MPDQVLEQVLVIARQFDRLILDGPAGLSEVTWAILLVADLAPQFPFSRVRLGDAPTSGRPRQRQTASCSALTTQPMNRCACLPAWKVAINIAGHVGSPLASKPVCVL